MREEWANGTQGLTRGSNSSSDNTNSSVTRRKAAQDINRIQTLTMASKAMRLKPFASSSSREVSERRQVGDVEEIMVEGKKERRAADTPWWKNVSMEEGM